MTRPLRIRLIAALLVLLTGSASAMQPDHHSSMHGSQMSMMEVGEQPLSELRGEEFDVGFVSMMVAHHEGAVEMAEWLLQRTESPELRSAAEAVIESQEPEIRQMKSWLREWYGREVDPTMASMMQDQMGSMMDRMAAGADADRAFLELMTEHHMSALDMAQLALVESDRNELRALARDIIVAQAGEIYQYRLWLSDGIR